MQKKHKKYTAEQFLLCFIRLTWSLPPHSPAGRFAHKLCSPLLLLSTFCCRQVLHLSRTMLTIFHCLCGSFCLRLASTFNHRPVMYSYYIYIFYFCHSGTIMIFFIPLILFLYSTFRKKTCFFSSNIHQLDSIPLLSHSHFS